MKKLALIAILSCILVAIVGIFWFQEMQYLMPTPVPADYKVVRPDELINYDSALLPQQHNRPKLLHFFSPDCPCSRFNLKHFKALNKEYSNKVDFYVVVDSQEKAERAKELVDSDITIVVDRDKSLANACGVYSTPQAAIIEASNELYFRGNYNKSRYCTNKDSNFVQMALDSMVAKREPPIFNELATNSYGCSLPTDKTSSRQ
jgi:hypothetical protein